MDIGSYSGRKYGHLRYVLLTASVLLMRVSFDAAIIGNAAPTELCGSKPPASFRVVLDVGHSPDKPGAISARGVPEYYFNGRLAADIARTLIGAGFVSTYVIRGRSGQAGLARRALRASALKADLFLSIHHDSVQDAYLEKWKYDGTEQMFSDRFAGFSIFVSRKSAQFDDSLRFAITLADALKAKGINVTSYHAEDIAGERYELLDPERGVYSHDQLVVLRNAQMPAALLEAGVIVNREEELLLSSDTYRQTIAAGVTVAVAAFCRTPSSAAQQ